MENTIRLEERSKGKGVFSVFDKFKLETYFADGFPVRHAPKLLFVMVLGLIYIGNTHHVENTVRGISKIQADVEDMRADYTTLKSELMFASKQSEVARRIKPYGLEESNRPPYKIIVKKGEY